MKFLTSPNFRGPHEATDMINRIGSLYSYTRYDIILLSIYIYICGHHGHMLFVCDLEASFLRCLRRLRLGCRRGINYLLRNLHSPVFAQAYYSHTHGNEHLLWITARKPFLSCNAQVGSHKLVKFNWRCFATYYGS
jgi:hypothetical protein